MNERELQQTIREMFLQGFSSRGITLRVQRNYQQRNHSAPDVPTLVYHRITTEPVGWTYKASTPTGVDTGKETHYSNELITYQVNALVVEPDPKDESLDDVTAADLVRMARMIAESERSRLKPLGINILHITSVADVPVQNESDNWEFQPSFDITFSVKQELSRDIGRVYKLTGHIKRV